MIKAIQNMRFKAIAAALFLTIAITGVFVFIFIRFQGSLVKASINYFVQERVGRAMNAKVTLGSIKTSPVGPTVLKNFTVLKETIEDTPFIFKTEKLIIYNNIPQIIFDKIFKKAGFKGINLVFKIENGILLKGDKPLLENINGFGKIVNNNIMFDDISGKCYNFPLSVYGVISGQTSMFDINIARYNIFAMGKIDFAKKRFFVELKKKPAEPDLGPARGTVSIVGNFLKKDLLQVSAFFDHVQFGRFDLQSQVDCEVDFSDTKNIKGFARTGGTILDFRPFNEIDANFVICDKSLKITSLTLGEDYFLSGFVNLYNPYQMDFTLDIKDGDLSQLLLVPDAESESKVSGKITGQVRTSGSLDNLNTVVKLKCGKGNLGNLDYESMNINLSGQGSLLKVSDSRILRKQGYIDLSGEVDLKSLWSQEPAKGLKWSCGNEAIIWEGWDIVKETNSKEFEMAKGVGRQKEFMVTFQGYLNDEQSWQDTQGHNQDEAVGVEYSLDEAKKVKMQLKNSEEVFSLEHKVRF